MAYALQHKTDKNHLNLGVIVGINTALWLMIIAAVYFIVWLTGG